MVYLLAARGWAGWVEFKAAWWLPSVGIVAVISLIGLFISDTLSYTLEARTKEGARVPTAKLLAQVLAASNQISADTLIATKAVLAATSRADADLRTAMVQVLRRAVDAA